MKLTFLLSFFSARDWIQDLACALPLAYTPSHCSPGWRQVRASGRRKDCLPCSGGSRHHGHTLPLPSECSWRRCSRDCCIPGEAEGGSQSPARQGLPHPQPASHAPESVPPKLFPKTSLPSFIITVIIIEHMRTHGTLWDNLDAATFRVWIFPQTFSYAYIMWLYLVYKIIVPPIAPDTTPCFLMHLSSWWWGGSFFI
jgi:hypothetical protein